MQRAARSEKSNEQQSTTAPGTRHKATRSLAHQSSTLGQLADYINNSLPAQGLAQLKEDILCSSRVQRLQGLAAEMQSSAPAQLEAQTAPLTNRTGLPDQLKAGVENLSGLSLDDVKVHYNTEKPAQLNALAYAQGADIHVAPGQDQHLPHEAWHIVQQKQGRVQAATQMKTGVPVNDNKGLEHEADVMGGRALHAAGRVSTQVKKAVQRRPVNYGEDPVQLFPFKKKNDKTNRAFRITNSGSKLEATQIAGDAEDPHSGYATYAVKADAIELGHIQSDPEEGSGIGSLLMYYLAYVAALQGKKKITIPTAWPTAIGFYELMGFTSSNPKGAAEFEAELSKSPDEIEKAENRYFQTRAKIDYDTNPENRKLRSKGWFGSQKERREFGMLPGPEQEKLIMKVKQEFAKKTPQDQDKIRATMLHGKAVGMTGMVGDTSTVLDKSKATLGRWSDVTVWTPHEKARVEASAKDKSSLTFFPPLPDEE